MSTPSDVPTGTLTFTIPDGGALEEMEPGSESVPDQPNVLVKDPAKNAAYFLDHQQLQAYARPLESEVQGYDFNAPVIAFSYPYDQAVIEPIPGGVAAALQSNTHAAPGDQYISPAQ